MDIVKILAILQIIIKIIEKLIEIGIIKPTTDPKVVKDLITQMILEA